MNQAKRQRSSGASSSSVLRPVGLGGLLDDDIGPTVLDQPEDRQPGGFQSGAPTPPDYIFDDIQFFDPTVLDHPEDRQAVGFQSGAPTAFDEVTVPWFQPGDAAYELPASTPPNLASDEVIDSWFQPGDVAYELLARLPEKCVIDVGQNPSGNSIFGCCVSSVQELVDGKRVSMLVLGAAANAERIDVVTNRHQAFKCIIGNHSAALPKSPAPHGHVYTRVLVPMLGGLVLVRVVNAKSISRTCRFIEPNIDGSEYFMCTNTQSANTIGTVHTYPVPDDLLNKWVDEHNANGDSSQWQYVRIRLHPPQPTDNPPHLRRLANGAALNEPISINALHSIIMDAIPRNDIKLIAEVIRQVCKKNQGRFFTVKNHDGQTLLFLAAKLGHCRAVAMLAAADRRLIDIPDSHRRTPIHAAVLHNNIEVVEMLVAGLESQSLDAPDIDGMTPLHHAAEQGNETMIDALSRLGTRAIDISDERGWTPLLHATRHGHLNAVQKLIKLGSKTIDAPDNAGWTPMHHAANNGDMDMISMLRESHSRALDATNADGMTPMHLASTRGHASVVEQLARFGSRAIDLPNALGMTCMHLAAMNQHASMVETLVRLGSKSVTAVNNEGKAPMHVAAMNGNTAVINALTACTQSCQAVDLVDLDGMTCVHYAAFFGHVSTLRALLIDREQQSSYPSNRAGMTLVHCAALSGCVAAIEFLVAKGFSTDSPDDNGDAPIHLCAMHGHAEAIGALVRLENRAIDTPNSKNWTAIHIAAHNGHSQVIEALVRLGSTAVDTPDNDGNIPLHLAALQGHVAAIEALIRLGSSVHTVNSQGWTPLI